ncbi:hypothetical protein WICPIJ_000582 [Wickerhamomyces pijperi]|uniref:Uncharacterized protein n=1 Tax=Wickerhamomyces pijperi TaxID=599730 RepID=A0A9P8TQQ5_WICPI|nr:hypothetical protein WICPIJ_000582 [Wickerhamomyces pijperi]
MILRGIHLVLLRSISTTSSPSPSSIGTFKTPLSFKSRHLIRSSANVIKGPISSAGDWNSSWPKASRSMLKRGATRYTRHAMRSDNSYWPATLNSTTDSKILTNLLYDFSSFPNRKAYFFSSDS